MSPRKIGDDRRRGLVRAETVVVAGARDRRPQQVGVQVDGADDRVRKTRNCMFVCGIVARVEQVDARVGRATSCCACRSR
jgi:hypothetical protein